jgi:hypothetical protein
MHVICKLKTQRPDILGREASNQGFDFKNHFSLPSWTGEVLFTFHGGFGPPPLNLIPCGINIGNKVRNGKTSAASNNAWKAPSSNSHRM